MAMTPEKKVKQAVVKQLKQYGAYYFYPVTGGYGASGVFDIVCGLNSLFVGIEVKATSKNKPTALQSYNAAVSKAAGCTVLLIHEGNVGLVGEVLQRIRDDPSYRSNPVCVWPFDGVEEGEFRFPS